MRHDLPFALGLVVCDAGDVHDEVEVGSELERNVCASPGSAISMSPSCSSIVWRSTRIVAVPRATR